MPRQRKLKRLLSRGRYKKKETTAVGKMMKNDVRKGRTTADRRERTKKRASFRKPTSHGKNKKAGTKQGRKYARGMSTTRKLRQRCFTPEDERSHAGSSGLATCYKVKNTQAATVALEMSSWKWMRTAVGALSEKIRKRGCKQSGAEKK